MCEGTSLAATQLATSLHANRPGRTRTCSPRFWSPLLATPALHRLLVFNDLAFGQQRRRCWTTPALALILALNAGSSAQQPLHSSHPSYTQSQPSVQERGIHTSYSSVTTPRGTT